MVSLFCEKIISSIYSRQDALKTLQHIDLAYGQNRTWKTKSEFYEPNQQEVSYKYAEPEGLGYQK